MTRKLWTRALRLYGYHGFLLAFAFLVAVPVASHGDRPGLHNLLDFYFTAGTKQAVTEAALLIYRPPLLDILPMYIIFLSFTSIAIPLARNIGWKPILWTSFVFWVLAQFGFRRTHLHDAIHSYADSVERDGFIRPVGLAISLVCGGVARCALGPGQPAA